MASADDGGFVVTYGVADYGRSTEFRANVYNADVRRTRTIVAGPGRPLAFDSARVDRADDGRFAIVYSRENAYGDSDIMLATYDAIGNSLHHFPMDTSSRHDKFPNVAINDSGNIVVDYEAWHAVSRLYEVQARRVTAAGWPGQEFNVGPSTSNDRKPRVVMDDFGTIFVAQQTYSTYWSVEVSEISASNQLLNRYAVGPAHLHDTIGLDDTRRFVVTTSVRSADFSSTIVAYSPITVVSADSDDDPWVKPWKQWDWGS